jgi:hypothetical protein
MWRRRAKSTLELRSEIPIPQGNVKVINASRSSPLAQEKLAWAISNARVMYVVKTAFASEAARHAQQGMDLRPDQRPRVSAVSKQPLP